MIAANLLPMIGYCDTPEQARNLILNGAIFVGDRVVISTFTEIDLSTWKVISYTPRHFEPIAVRWCEHFPGQLETRFLP